MIYVVGPGRCGSSAVARVLHERMGIPMGKVFPTPDEHNPEGYYEDSEFKAFNQRFLHGSIRFPEFANRIGELIGRRNKSTCGLKDPRLSYLLVHYLAIDPEAVVIRCRRPLKDVVESMKRCYGWEPDEACRRERMLDLVNHPMTDIDMSEPRTDSWIQEQLACVRKSF